MITNLRITDFAIVDHLELNFDSGLVILTGETGAGKSIVLDAIQALIGGTTDVSMVRAGTSKARLEAVIKYTPDQIELIQILEQEDLMDEPGQIVLEREIRLEGRSTSRVNGHSVNQAILREIGSLLVDIHGQSEHLSLLNTRAHLGLLDRYARNDESIADYTRCYQKLTQIRKELHELLRADQDDQSRLELIRFQLDEIQAAHLNPGEDDELEKERTRLANAENLASITRESLALLEESSGDVPAIADLFGQVAHQLSTLARVDPSQTMLADNAHNLFENIQDLAGNIRKYAEQIEYNPRRLEEVEERLDMIHRLIRKYGGTIEAVLDFARKNEVLLERISNADERIQDLQAKETGYLSELSDLAMSLSARRKESALSLADKVEEELSHLRMDGARFTVDLSSQTDENGLIDSKGTSVRFDASGIDQVEFLIAPNPGEGFKPLVKIASGGETSRLMLALKNVLAREDQIPTLIFDEIDQGIGGRVGLVVGKKLWELARFHQVFCVTHLPQLAAYGNQHYRVAKQVHQNRTSTSVELLTGEDRVEELAMMLGTNNEVSIQSAREMISSVQSECNPIE